MAWSTMPPIEEIRHGARGRLHAAPAEWRDLPATDYWITGSSTNTAPTGWTMTSMVSTVGSGADFASSSDKGTPNALTEDAGSDLVKSPQIFGDYVSMKAIEYHLGTFPRYLIAQFYATFSTASNNETTTNIGFVEAGGSPIVAADTLAAIFSDGTNFTLQSGADSDAGAAIDTSAHLWTIRLKFNGVAVVTDMVDWQIDNVAQGTIDLETDLFPCFFGWGSGTSNIIALHWAHIYYSVTGLLVHQA